MSAVTMARDVTPEGDGWRVNRDDGTSRMVLPRRPKEEIRWAVFSGQSTDQHREPPLGFSGSWGDLNHAIEWARTDGLGS